MSSAKWGPFCLGLNVLMDVVIATGIQLETPIYHIFSMP